MTTPLPSATTTAGISEARNRSRIDRFATVPRTIIVIDGGIRMPVPDAAATIDADHSRRYPARVIGGGIARPLPRASAVSPPATAGKSAVGGTTPHPPPPRDPPAT